MDFFKDIFIEMPDFYKKPFTYFKSSFEGSVASQKLHCSLLTYSGLLVSFQDKLNPTFFKYLAPYSQFLKKSCSAKSYSDL